MKFTPPGGSIDLVARRAGDGIRVEVSDSGCGINPALSRTCSIDFGRGRVSSRPHGGLGIGLAIVRDSSSFMGSVEAMSAGVERGSQFVVQLPAVVPRRDNEATSASAKLL